jgi:hypothetical protein
MRLRRQCLCGLQSGKLHNSTTFIGILSHKNGRPVVYFMENLKKWMITGGSPILIGKNLYHFNWG